jgi:hypothetical protein
MKMESIQIEAAVLRKLLARRVIGRHHMQLDTLLRCEWKPEEKKDVRRAIERLVRQGYVITVKQSKNALTLNGKRMDEIMDLARAR